MDVSLPGGYFDVGFGNYLPNDPVMRDCEDCDGLGVVSEKLGENEVTLKQIHEAFPLENLQDLINENYVECVDDNWYITAAGKGHIFEHLTVEELK